PQYVLQVNDGKIGMRWMNILHKSDMLEWETGEWYYIQVIHDGNKIRFIRDGEIVGYVVNNDSSRNAGQPLIISPGGTESTFYGKLDELYIGLPSAGLSDDVIYKVEFNTMGGSLIAPKYSLNQGGVAPTA